MKMSRSSIVTSGRRPSRPDGTYYREARKLRGSGRRRRGQRAMAVVVATTLMAAIAYFWLF